MDILKLIEMIALLPAILLLAFISTTAIHELGHAAVAKLCGYHVAGFRFFSLHIKFTDGKIRVRQNETSLLGQCIINTEGTESTLKAELEVLGGCIFNILAGILCVVVILCHISLLTHMIWFSLGFANFFAGILNLIPYDSNDGATFGEIRRFGYGNFNKLMNINAAESDGVSLCDMPSSWFVPESVGGSMAGELMILRNRSRRIAVVCSVIEG